MILSVSLIAVPSYKRYINISIYHIDRISSYSGVLLARRFVYSPILGILLAWHHMVSLKEELIVMIYVRFGMSKTLRMILTVTCIITVS